MKKTIYIFVLLFAFNVKAQHPYYYTLNDENGLPSNEVYQIVQDKKGYIWIGCDAGLFRYNGFQYKSFKNIRQNSRSISNLVFDSEQNLWCRNFSGQIFKQTNDSLYLIADYSQKAKKIQIAFRDKGGFWKIDTQFLTLHDNKGREFLRYKLPFNLDTINSGVELFCFKDILWIDFLGIGLYYLDINEKYLKPILPSPKNIVYSSVHFFINKNKLYLFRAEAEPSKKAYIYSINAELKTAKLESQIINSTFYRTYAIYSDKNDNLWLATSKGVKSVKNISEIISDTSFILPDKKISSVLHDKEGNFWFSDLQNGIHFVSQLSSIKYDDKNSSLIDSDISKLKKLNDSVLLIGTYSGNVFLFNTQIQKFELPVSIQKNKGITVKDIEIHNGKAYISRGKLSVYDLELKNITIPDFYRNARDLLIYNENIISVHPEFVAKTSLKNIKHNKILEPEIIYKTGGRKVALEKNTGIIYFALNDGLYAYQKNVLSKVKLNNEEIYTFSMISNNDHVWVGTHNQGILKISNAKVDYQIPINNYFEDKGVKALAEDADYLWGATNSNWFRVNKQSKILETYSNNIGVNPKDVYDIEICGQSLFIGTRKCLMKIPINLNPLNYNVPEVIIYSIVSDNCTYTTDSVIQLPYNFTNLKFEFISFSYSSKKDLFYKYRLIGLDSNWVRSSYENPTALFSSLPSGEYTFQLQSVNESGIESNVYSKSFIVATPLWQKGWFYFIVSLVSVLLVVAITRYQIKVLKKRSDAEKKMIQSQLTALKAQMNPHFMYNALNSIQALILKHDVKNSNLYLSKFSNLMRKVLDASGKEQISLSEETEILDLYLSLEKLRFGNDFTYSISITEEIDSYNFFIPPLLLQPFVENAIKHGLLHKKGEKKLSVEFSLQNSLVYCRIKDNGIGRKHAQQIKERMSERHTSFSTQATEKRVDLLNRFNYSGYDIIITDLYDNDIPTGTEVLIKIPKSTFGN